MRGYEVVPRRRARVVIVVALAAIGALLAFASSAAVAAPRPIGSAVRKWSVSKIEQGVGKVLVKRDVQTQGQLNQTFDLGPAAFNFPLNLVDGRAVGHVFATPDGGQSTLLLEAPTLDPLTQGSAKGGVAHLDEYQTYEKEPRPGGASLRITIHDIKLETADANGTPTASECSDLSVFVCHPIQAVVRYHARAYPVPGGSDSTTKPRAVPFFNVGGAVYLYGYQHDWFIGAATSADSRTPFWADAEFNRTGDANKDTSGSLARLGLADAIRLNVPLGSVHFQQRFTVHVTMDAEAIDDRGGESGAQAFILDPQHASPGLTARGLTAHRARKFKEPPIRPRPAARCPAGPRPHAGRVQLNAPAFSAGEASGTALVLVTRRGGSRGATSVMVNTSGGSARSRVDFKPTRTQVRFENGDTSPRLVEVPIREDLTRESPESFKVSLAHLRCSRLGKLQSASVTIVDDDQPPPPPPPAFTIGGTVDGLQGSGLVLSNLGAPVSVSANGSFTFPGTASAGQGYEINVETQPSNPSQVCTVQNGSGHVASANVTDIAVHCQTPAIPSGLDSTFGDGGRVSTPVGGNGQGEGVVIQPSGQIVTAGWRTVGTGVDTDFALTRNNSDGSLDTGFGSGGIATTNLGGGDDQALDAALLPDSGIVAVGRTDALGILKTAFGVVRYLPDGTPNPSFGTGGIVMTPFFGKGAVANAVAVQPDGKIVVAGFATEASGINSDFALARYNPDGTLDQSFDDDGVVTTDLSGQDDDARALAIQPDGNIVVVGSAGDNIGLVRYASDGSLDQTFGSAGMKISDLGTSDADGVALTASGQIVIVGANAGDFMLVRYGANGALDSAFGTGGVVTTDISGGDDFAEDLTIDAAGRIIVVGRATSSTILDMALARYHADGTLDTSFATNGILTADFHGRGEFGQDVAIDSAGRIVAAGYTANGGDTEFALMRANP